MSPSTPLVNILPSSDNEKSILPPGQISIQSELQIPKLFIHSGISDSHTLTNKSSLDKFFDSGDFVRQIVLIDRNLIGVLADDSCSASIFKIFRQEDENSEFKEVHCTNGVGMILRIFPPVKGRHLLFETSDGLIHDVGDPQSTIMVSASTTTRFLSRCYWIEFANVENHVPSQLSYESDFRILCLD